jgi:hypothetical protein
VAYICKPGESLQLVFGAKTDALTPSQHMDLKHGLEHTPGIFSWKRVFYYIFYVNAIVLPKK